MLTPPDVGCVRIAWTVRVIPGTLKRLGCAFSQLAERKFRRLLSPLIS